MQWLVEEKGTSSAESHRHDKRGEPDGVSANRGP